MALEMPQMASASYTSSAVGMHDLLAHGPVISPSISRMLVAPPVFAESVAQRRSFNDAAARAFADAAAQAIGENTMATTPRRLVQVFIADTDDNVPLADCLLHKGEPQLTDLTDQELFFEVDIKSILDQHNEKRTKLVNKSVKERTEHLEPARIRDLKMTVVTIAQF